MTFSDAMNYIETINAKGSILGLDTTRELLKRIGNPQDRLKFVHIAGTNGKGSVLAYTSNILSKAGYKTGRYISPVINQYCEKIQIDGVFITMDAVSAIMEVIKKACDEMVAEGFEQPTAFEIETAMAFLYFLNEDCDIVVLEVGMGGRDDSTNVIPSPLCAVITSISLDHVGVIGNNLEEIAECKAGIIKDNTSVVCYCQDKVVMDIITKQAEAVEGEVIFTAPDKVVLKEDSINGQVFDYKGLTDITTSLLGEHQLLNAACAIEVAFVLREKGFNITDEDICQGIAAARWQARFDVISRRPFIIADGAHNVDGAKTFIKAVDKYLAGYIKIFVMGVLKDKDYNSIIELTNQSADAIITINPDNKRALTDTQLKDAIDKITGGTKTVIAAGRIESGMCLANQILMQLNDDRAAIVVFGSLSFMGDLYRYVYDA